MARDPSAALGMTMRRECMVPGCALFEVLVIAGIYMDKPGTLARVRVHSEGRNK